MDILGVAHLGTPVQGCRRWGCLWFGGWEAPLLHLLSPRLPPAPRCGYTGRRRGWNGDRSSMAAPQNPHCCSPRRGPTGHSLQHPGKRPTPWPSALAARGAVEVEAGEKVRRAVSGSEEVTGRVPKDRPEMRQKSESVCLCVRRWCVWDCGFGCQEKWRSLLFCLLSLSYLHSQGV